MRCSDLRVRLLAVVSATTLAATAVAACGSDSTPDTGAQSDSGGAANGDARGDAFASGDGAGGDGTTDSSVADTSATDSGGDERPPSIRRPFLVGSSLRSARSQARDDWSAARLREDEAFTLDAGIGGELAKAWLTDGLEEHASIAAFARFTMMLLSVAAPPELVAASQRASLDEITHARDCFALARRYGARDAGPGALDVHDSLGPMSLADLAALTAEEGCVGETLGAALAGEQLAVAVDPEVRRVLARIVRDEARHAELAWRFIAWAVGEEQRGALGAAGVTAAVAAAAAHAIAATRAMEIRPAVSDVAAWHAHGRLTCAEAREASERAIVDVVGPCLEALGLRSQQPPARRDGLSPAA